MSEIVALAVKLVNEMPAAALPHVEDALAYEAPALAVGCDNQ